jgi:hypothetical protein
MFLLMVGLAFVTYAAIALIFLGVQRHRERLGQRRRVSLLQAEMQSRARIDDLGRRARQAALELARSQNHR